MASNIVVNIGGLRYEAEGKPGRTERGERQGILWYSSEQISFPRDAVLARIPSFEQSLRDSCAKDEPHFDHSHLIDAIAERQRKLSAAVRRRLHARIEVDGKRYSPAIVVHLYRALIVAWYVDFCTRELKWLLFMERLQQISEEEKFRLLLVLLLRKSET